MGVGLAQLPMVQLINQIWGSFQGSLIDIFAFSANGPTIDLNTNSSLCLFQVCIMFYGSFTYWVQSLQPPMQNQEGKCYWLYGAYAWSTYCKTPLTNMAGVSVWRCPEVLHMHVLCDEKKCTA